ncbi:hypothetical protein WA538_005268 [Blastocystis sp. DL]
MRMVEKNSTLTLDPVVMEKHGFNREKYSCIYTLSKNAGSKYIRLFTDSDVDNTIVFDGSCKTSLSARANPQTKQFQESILRLKRKQNPEMEMHFLSEKERRELNAQRRDERDKNKRESRAHMLEERKMRKVRDTRILNGDMSPEEMRQKLIRLLRERSFVSARDAADFLNMPLESTTAVLKEISERQQRGEHMNEYQLLPMYRI